MPDAVSTRSGSDRVLSRPAVPIGRTMTRSLSLPVLTWFARRERLTQLLHPLANLLGPEGTNPVQPEREHNPILVTQTHVEGVVLNRD